MGVYTHGCLAQELQKRVLDPLELGFPVVVSIRCGCGNQTRVFCKSSACANHCAISSALTFLLLLLLPGRVPCCVCRGQRATCRRQSLPFPPNPSHLLYLLLDGVEIRFRVPQGPRIPLSLLPLSPRLR